MLTAAAVGCGHTRTVEDTKTTPSEGTSDTPADKKSGDSSSARARAGARDRQVTFQGDAPIKSDSREGAPPLATSPVGLLKPDALEGIQNKLASKGHLPKERQSGKLDPATRDALREFQRESNLPATGVPDDVTVQKLGLSPTDVFRASGDGGASGGSSKKK
ncbi:MAG: peptidoglycan-binding protein [Deltaproteobacteria bacterium]|nr:peptidoglycan-binding protein [Deltaproteobacteria bacterium]